MVARATKPKRGAGKTRAAGKQPARARASREGGFALDGIRIVDLGTMITAPFAAMLLADLGADVIKVEHPDGGDPFRRTLGNDYGPNYIVYNHNKRSIQLDLKSEEGRAALLALIARADILIENYRPGVVEKLGLGGDALLAANPRLVHCSITGFGASGPYAGRPAYDTVGIALSGILSLYLDPDKPTMIGPTLSDNVTGMMAAQGMLAGLIARDRTGRPQRVEVNMLEAAIALIPDPFAYHTQAGIRFGPRHRAYSSQCFAFRCADGRPLAVHISVQDKFWWLFLDAIGERATIGVDERFTTRKGRIANFEELEAILAGIIATRPRAHWEQALLAHDVPHAPIHMLPEVLEDPQVRHLATFETVRHPAKGDVTAMKSPVHINGRRRGIKPPPALGEHTQEVLAEIGWTRRGS